MSQQDDMGGGANTPRQSAPANPNRTVAVLSAIIRYWALGGGFITAGLAVMTAASAVSNILFSAPFSADYELVKHFIAVAIFMFLPYCQLSGANVTVDIFTENMSAGKKAAMALFSSAFAVAFSLLLFRQMSYGLLSYIRYPETTPVLKLPLWTAFPPILLSLALLFVAATITALNGVRIMRGRSAWLDERHDMPVE